MPAACQVGSATTGEATGEQLQALQQTPLAALQPKTQLEKQPQALQRTPLAALQTDTQREKDPGRKEPHPLRYPQDGIAPHPVAHPQDGTVPHPVAPSRQPQTMVVS
jgi:hypothetical protein